VSRSELTPAQLADADILRQQLMTAIAADLDGLVALLATKTDRDLFGATEFQVRDLVHAIGAKALQTAGDLRKKRAMTGPAEPVQTVTTTPSSNVGSPNGS
jgi:hypothetical protein